MHLQIAVDAFRHFAQIESVSGVDEMNAARPLVGFGVGRTGGVGLPLEDKVAAELIVVEEARGSDGAAGKTSQADLG